MDQHISVFDMKSGYYQVEAAEECKPMTAFTVGPLVFFFNITGWHLGSQMRQRPTRD